MPYRSAVEQAIKYMRERYSEPLSLTDIARSATLSRSHFLRVFKEDTGVTPGQFLTAVRIHEAKRMVLATSMSVSDVSLAVGYSSLGSFTNRFTAVAGVSPGRFRCIASQQESAAQRAPLPGTDPPIPPAVLGKGRQHGLGVPPTAGRTKDRG
jgi:transcriptional regulator GlxA family with amidase domain